MSPFFFKVLFLPIRDGRQGSRVHSAMILLDLYFPKFFECHTYPCLHRWITKVTCDLHVILSCSQGLFFFPVPAFHLTHYTLVLKHWRPICCIHYPCMYHVPGILSKFMRWGSFSIALHTRVVACSFFSLLLIGRNQKHVMKWLWLGTPNETHTIALNGYWYYKYHTNAN